MRVYSAGGFADDGAAMMFIKAAALARPDVAAEYEGTLEGPLEDDSVLVTMLRRVPSTIEKGTVMGAIMKRGPRGYVSLPCSLKELRKGARVAVCIPVAARALEESRPWLQVVLADSAEECLSMLDSGEVEAAVLPEMEVLISGIGIANSVEDGLLPQAASQGAVGVICRSDDDNALSWARSVNHPPTRIEIGVERGVLKMMGAGPFTPVGVSGTLSDMFVHVKASSYVCPEGRRDVDDYVAIDYVMDDLLDIGDYLSGKR
ncbi:MAG: hypothetical protein IKR86_06040 [Candidatus Methanomethylophilaceae archaeon]|nr:hypothetical protein [Candidatus Methanomethylophilaceae archaeon]